MTPLEFDILLHYATTREDYRKGDFSAPAVHDAILNFESMGLLRPATTLAFLPDPQRVYEMPDSVAETLREFVSRINYPAQKWEVTVNGEDNLHRRPTH